MTQNSCKKVEFDPERGSLVNRYYYGFILDWQLIVKTRDLNTKKRPVLLMELCYTDSWGRYSLEGYAFCEIPQDPGSYEISVPSWKPKRGSETEVMHFFLGGATRVRELSDIASPSFKIGDNIESSMNRLTSKTVSSGSVKLRFNISHQDWYSKSSLMLPRALKNKERNIKREEMHKQSRTKYRTRQEAAKNVFGPQLMHTHNGELMSRYNNPI